MKSLVQNYTFSTSAKTITLTDFSASRPVLLERLLMVIDATLGSIIYNAADSTVATATVSSNNVITLSALTGSAANADKLTIVYDTLPGDPQSPQKTTAYASPTTVLSTELNSLANNANSALSSAFDNSTTRYPVCDIVLNLAVQGSARSTGGVVALYMCPALDGTNYDDAVETVSEVVAAFPLDAATTARRRTIRGVTLPPSLVKFFVRNVSGVAFGASGNTIAVYPDYQGGV